MEKSRILIVEDEPSIAELIQYSLAGRGYEIASVVTTGEEALETVERQNVDLVLMDIVLGSEMSGTTAAEKIRSSKNIPIIFLTSYFNESLLDSAKLSEPYSYLLKPFNEKELYASIELALYKDILDKKRMRMESLLKCSRSINQLITNESKRDLAAVCKNLTSLNWISSAWIILIDDTGKITEWAEAGLGNNFQKLLSSLQGSKPPQWCKNVFAFLNPVKRTTGCEESMSLYFEKIEGNETLFLRLEADGKIHGMLALSVSHKDLEREEINLLKNIASDITIALSRKELEIKNNLIEQKLIDSEKRYRQVVENAIDIIFTTDNKGFFTYVNKAGVLNSGYTLDELLNINYVDLILPEYKDQLQSFYRNQLANKTLSSYIEYPFYTKKGEVRWYGQNATLLIENKLPKGFHCISRDISERKNMEVALLESEKRYRQLVESSPDGIVVLNQGRIIFANEAFLKLYGATDAMQVLSKPLTELMHPDSVDVKKARIKSRQSNEAGVSLHEQKFTRLDGSTIIVEVTASPVIFHNDAAVQFVIRDITSRKHVEDELRRQQLEVNTLLDSMPGLTFFKDVNYKYIIVNQNFCDMLGYTKEEIIGKTDFDLMPRHVAEKYHADDIKVLNSGKELSVTEERTLVRGRYLTIGTRKVPLKDESGQVIGLIGLGIDVTEQKAAEEAIKRYSKEMEELNAEKDKFFSIISHDLRSPFQGLLGLSNAMIEEYETLTPEETKLFINNIHNSAKSLFNLIENLLQWSRIQRGKLDLQPVITGLYEEVLYVFNLLQRNASNKEIKLTNTVNEGMKVMSDVNILHSTLQNLISNSIKFTPRSGEIKIVAEKDVEFVSVSVIDNGIGISEDDIQKLFRIDTQHSTPGTEREAGTGLGLVICKELIQRQGGNIWVESEAGKGSTFTFTLPVANE